MSVFNGTYRIQLVYHRVFGFWERDPWHSSWDARLKDREVAVRNEKGEVESTSTIGVEISRIELVKLPMLLSRKYPKDSFVLSPREQLPYLHTSLLIKILGDAGMDEALFVNPDEKIWRGTAEEEQKIPKDIRPISGTYAAIILAKDPRRRFHLG